MNPSILAFFDSGHYRVPGPVEQGGLVQSFSFMPIATALGFAESLLGLNVRDKPETGRFMGEIAYGIFQRPRGYGKILHKDIVWTSPSKPEIQDNDDPRVCYWETFFDLGYRFVFRGPGSEKLIPAIRGEIPREGILYGGNSENFVEWLEEGSGPTEWIVPGSQYLTVRRSGRGYNKLTAEMFHCDLTLPTEIIPKDAWFGR